MERNFIGRSVEDGRHDEKEGSMLYGMPYILYQPELPELLSDCFHMSFQSRAVSCNSQEIKNFPCQDTVNQTPKFEFRVYHNM